MNNKKWEWKCIICRIMDKKWRLIRIVCGILSAFPFILAIIVGSGLLRGIPHTFTRDVWFGGLCSLVPTTVVAGATFYMTVRMQEQEDRHREQLERPRFVGAGFQLQLVLKKYEDVKFQQDQEYQYWKNGWSRHIDHLKNSFWMEIAGRNLNHYNMHILKNIEVSSVELNAEGNVIKPETFFTRIEYYPGENTDFRINIACVLEQQDMKKMDKLLSCYLKGMEPSSSCVRCRFSITDDRESAGYSLNYQANLKRKDGIAAFGTERQLFTVKIDGNEP